MRLFFPHGSGELASLMTWHARQPAGKAGKVHLVRAAPQRDAEVQVLEEGDAFDPAGLQFDVRRYYGALDVRGLRAAGRRLIVAAETTSTQEVLRGPLFDGWEPWRLVFVADQQRAGRGRGANTWVSPSGCLMWSFQVVQTDGTRLPMLQYVVALAVVRALRRLPGGDEAAARLRIKWPNDLYAAPGEANGVPAKVGGILCQSTYWRNQFVVTVGVGLNVTNAEPSVRLQQLFANPDNVSRETVLAAFFTVFEEMLDVFEREGFVPFVREYEQQWMHSQQRLHLEDGTEVVVEGLTRQGLLQARDNAGVRYELQPDGNSLDWFKGLIKKKTNL